MKSELRPIKSLGQHFLRKPEIARRIAEALVPRKDYNTVIEIGPGTGILTTELVSSEIDNLYCVEVDQRAVELLRSVFPELRDRIIHADFLQFHGRYPWEGNFAVIGNFPYNISSQILFRILDDYKRIPVVVGMFQKEVAERIASPPGNRDYGILSVLLQAHYKIEYLFTVPPEMFNPPPKVNSGVIRMELKDENELKCDLKKFRQLVKSAFNQRRKVLRNSLKSYLPPDSSSIPYLNLRPEQLSFSQFEELTLLLLP